MELETIIQILEEIIAHAKGWREPEILDPNTALGDDGLGFTTPGLILLANKINDRFERMVITDEKIIEMGNFEELCLHINAEIND
ncbi:MAG: hypothetical protein MI921_10305 [Cytophagales bacterium]|nr:hypothetical protein [Cytophagales bacterium]